MTYKTILAYLGDTDHAQAVLAAAATFGNAFDAHVTGLHVVPPIFVPPAIAVQVTPELMEVQERALKQEAEKVEAAFRQRMSREGFPNDWRTVPAHMMSVTEVVAMHTRCADLVLVGQQIDTGYLGGYGLAEDVMMESGRPVVMIPASAKINQVAKRVMVAWNGSREAARAVFDAVPMLQAAENVRLLWINPPNGGGESNDLPGSELASVLSRHGIKTEAAISVTRDLKIAEELLSRVADHGSDLLVMGGYGHSRFRELVLGGATRELLKSMTVPVLMSH